jgi:hypothetical protein
VAQGFVKGEKCGQVGLTEKEGTCEYIAAVTEQSGVR